MNHPLEQAPIFAREPVQWTPMRAREILGVLLFGAAASMAAQPAGWESFGPPLFQISDVATGSDETTVYASGAYVPAAQSGIFVSTNAGNLWTGLIQAANGESFGDLLVDPGNSRTIYTGTLGSDHKTRFYSSLDGGVTWSLGQTLGSLCVPSFAPGASAGAALVACGTGLWKTADSGQTWQALSAPFTQTTRLASGAAGVVWAYGPTTIFRSSDGGITWQAVGTPPPCAGINALAADPTQPNVLIAGTGVVGGTGLVCGSIYRSADGGATWTATTGASGAYITDIIVNPVDPARMYASAGNFPGILPQGGVFASVDGGATWTNMALPANSASRLALSPSGQILYAATPVGVYEIGVTSGTPTCTPNDFTLCLDGGRFRVQSSWTRPDQTNGSGHAMGLTSDTGYFWFFDPTNVEVIVKVLEGCGTNSYRWVFASGLTNVFVSITVTDIVTNDMKTYTNAQGTAFVPVQDTHAFTCSP